MIRLPAVRGIPRYADRAILIGSPEQSAKTKVAKSDPLGRQPTQAELVVRHSPTIPSTDSAAEGVLFTFFKRSDFRKPSRLH